MGNNTRSLGVFKLYADSLYLGVADTYLIEGVFSSVFANVELADAFKVTKEIHLKSEFIEVQFIGNDSEKVEGLFSISVLYDGYMTIESAGLLTYTPKGVNDEHQR